MSPAPKPVLIQVAKIDTTKEWGRRYSYFEDDLPVVVDAYAKEFMARILNHINAGREVLIKHVPEKQKMLPSKPVKLGKKVNK